MSVLVLGHQDADSRKNFDFDQVSIQQLILNLFHFFYCFILILISRYLVVQIQMGIVNWISFVIQNILCYL